MYNIVHVLRSVCVFPIWIFIAHREFVEYQTQYNLSLRPVAYLTHPWKIGERFLWLKKRKCLFLFLYPTNNKARMKVKNGKLWIFYIFLCLNVGLIYYKFSKSYCKIFFEDTGKVMRGWGAYRQYIIRFIVPLFSKKLKVIIGTSIFRSNLHKDNASRRGLAISGMATGNKRRPTKEARLGGLFHFFQMSKLQSRREDLLFDNEGRTSVCIVLSAARFESTCVPLF